MRILVLANVPPGAVGGAEVQALQLARQWAGDGHHVTVAGPANLSTRSGTLSVVRLPMLKWPRALRALSYLCSVLMFMLRRRNGFDVVYCRFLREQALAACLSKAVFALRQPIVACPECAAPGGEAAYIARSPWKKIWIGLLRSGLATINVISRRIEQELVELGFHGVSLSRIPNGVALPSVVKRPTHEGPLRILFAGRLVPQKGVDVLLEAASRLKADGHSFELRIVGGGPLRSSLERRLEELELLSCVELCGPVPPAEMAAVFSRSDLFVLPSLFEGLPVVLLEAFAHALPVVATRVSGSEDAVDPSNGWLVAPGSVDQLTDALREALGSSREHLRQMGERGREKIAQSYDMSRVADGYIELFEDLLKRSSSAFQGTKNTSAGGSPAS